jgi:hypothetical protein
VLFIPATATGRGPEIDPVTKKMGIRSKDIKPQWVEAPLLTMLARRGGGLVPYRERHRSPRKAMPSETSREKQSTSARHPIGKKPSGDSVK